MTTVAQRARMKGFRETLRIRGRKMTASSGEQLVVVVHDEAILLDPNAFVQAEKPVYAELNATAGSVANPRAVTSFSEADSGLVYQVIRYDESAADAVVWKWFCEVQRQQY